MNYTQLKNAILQKAISGNLLPQNHSDTPAEELLLSIQKEKQQLIKQKKLKPQKPLAPISEDEIPFPIPDTWRWVRLGEVVTMQAGKTPTRGNQLYWTNGKYNWITISDMVAGDIITSTKEKVSQIAVDKCFGQISPKGSLIMSFKLTIGRTSILGIDAYHNEAIVTINSFIDKNHIFRNYLLLTLPIIANMGDTKDAIKGKTLNNKSMATLPFPLPPLEEQKRIVEKLEEILPVVEEYGKAQEELNLLNKTLPIKLKNAILQKAISGNLLPQ
ncbi:MAG: restriction endonuclease subunit S, partial [Bacteroidota bacterium]|nr:restriction endonuclease subunit S [Bacteroidota bacterium]